MKKNASKLDNESPKNEEKEQVDTEKEATPKSDETKVIEKKEENVSVYIIFRLFFFNIIMITE